MEATATYIRGFSFMPKDGYPKIIEDEDIERAWKHTKRERLKQREEKIWAEFVKENDDLTSIYKDDLYDYLSEMPRDRLEKLMDEEIEKMKNEIGAISDQSLDKLKSSQEQEDEDDIVDPPRMVEDNQHTCVVTFADDRDQCDMFQIFDEDHSGNEDGLLNDSINSVATVCETRTEATADTSLDKIASSPAVSSDGKSMENVTNVIESSIYCARVKDLRIKINDTMMSISGQLEFCDVFNVEEKDIARMIRRATEFSSRFNRIYMYQLQRQMNDIKRNNSLLLPFAKHTQFQSQMVRIVSLHQNLLQSLQVFHKSLDQTWCIRDSATTLHSLVSSVRNITALCSSVQQPRDLTAAAHLYDDGMLVSCSKLDQSINGFTKKCEESLNSSQSWTKRGRRRLKSPKKKKNGKGPEADPKLSMYSFNGKSVSSRDARSSKSRGQLSSTFSPSPTMPTDASEESVKGVKKTKGRRPLMRDPHAGRPRMRRPRAPRDHDVPTMVEAVEQCISSHGSEHSASHDTPHRDVPSLPPPTPPNLVLTLPPVLKKSPQVSPRKAPIAKPTKPGNVKPPSPPPPISLSIKTSISNEASESQDTCDQLSPVSKIQCFKKKGNLKKPKEKEPQPEEKEKKSPYLIPPSFTLNLGSLKSTSRHGSISSSGLRSAVISTCEVTETLKLEPEKPSKKPGSSRSVTLKLPDEKFSKNQRPLSPEQDAVSRLLKQLCSGDSATITRKSTSKNVQLINMKGSSPRYQPSTPQLLRILEETIQKKVPKSLCHSKNHDLDKLRLSFNIDEKITNQLFQYRTKFIQHMLTSPIYANSVVGKPWEMIGSISDNIINEILTNCVREMEIRELLDRFFNQEACLT